MEMAAELPPSRGDERCGAVPLVPRACCVCRAWRHAVREHPAPLWRHVDLSFGWCRPTDNIIKRYCISGRAFQSFPFLLNFSTIEKYFKWGQGYIGSS